MNDNFNIPDNFNNNNNGNNRIGLIGILLLICLVCFVIGLVLPLIAFLLRIIGALVFVALMAVVFVTVKNNMEKK